MKIALIGSAPSSVQLAPTKDASYDRWLGGKPSPTSPPSPFIDQEWQIWGCSPGAWAVLPRADRWFEVHRWEPGQAWFSPEYTQFLREFRGPVYTGGPIPEITNHVVYPIELVEAEFSAYFLHSSLSLMLAMAILEIEQSRAERVAAAKAAKMKFPDLAVHSEEDTIGMWGVDMAACTSGDTKVLTADLRWIRADEVAIGDKLVAFDEEAQDDVGGAIPHRRYREAEVLEASRLTKPCYRVILEDGREIICSEDHKWLTHAENTCRWKETKDLVTPQHREDRPTRIVKLTDVWVEDKSWEAGYLAAAFDGEGHLSQNLRNGKNGVLRAGFAQRDNEMSELVIKAMQDRGFDLALDHDGDCKKYTVRGGRAANMEFLGSIRPRRLIEKFKADDLGIAQKIGTIAVVATEFIGDYPVIGLRTSTKTFIAEGLASHNTEEYGDQRAGCQFFILEALRRGIEIFIPPESCLLRPKPVYGISEWDHNYIKCTVRMRELNQRKAHHEMQLAENQRQVTFLTGAIDDMNYFINTWTSPYGLPAGIKVKQDPGTGLGGGFTMQRPADSFLHQPAPADENVAVPTTAGGVTYAGNPLELTPATIKAMRANMNDAKDLRKSFKTVTVKRTRKGVVIKRARKAKARK